MKSKFSKIKVYFFVLAGLFYLQSCKKCDDPIIIYECDGKEVFKFVEQMPQYQGGQDSLAAFFKSNLIYPKKSKEDRVEGNVKVEFIVNIYGNIECIKILQSLNTECDNESLRLVNTMPLWIPGKHNGMHVDVSIAMNIEYKL